MSFIKPLSLNQRIALSIIVSLYLLTVFAAFFGIYVANPSALTFGGFLAASAGAGLVALGLGIAAVKA